MTDSERERFVTAVKSYNIKAAEEIIKIANRRQGNGKNSNHINDRGPSS